MDDPNLLERITYNPGILGGKPIIRGKRVAVEHVLAMLAAGHTFEDMVEDFPWLEAEDVQACLLYSARMAGPERFEPVTGLRLIAGEPRGTLGDFLSLWNRDPSDATFADDLERANSKEPRKPDRWGS